jgi:hypothetical protein
VKSPALGKEEIIRPDPEDFAALGPAWASSSASKLLTPSARLASISAWRLHKYSVASKTVLRILAGS